MSFNYRYTQRKNRPSGLKLDDNSKDLGLTPLIFGDLVGRDDSCWNFVFSPIVSHGMTCYLKHLITDHHKLFKSLFPERNLIPKHHLMIHYSSCIRKVGPFIHMWCMRFEAKHNFFKNFKNITKTLVRKHQNQLTLNFEKFYLLKSWSAV